MKKVIFLLAALFCSMTMNADKIDIAQVAKSDFYAKGIRSVKSMKDGRFFTQMSADRKRIVKSSFRTGAEVEVIFDVEKARDIRLKSFDDYIMSPDESLILIQTETKPIYRRSFTAVYYIYNVRNNTLEPLSDGGAQQVPLFSPDSHQIAFVRDNNIHLVKLLFGKSESQVTTDGRFNHIINGIPDWVYEEEFMYNRAFDFSADSKMLAYVKFDESKVKTYSMPMYKGLCPALDQYYPYSGFYSYKYPIAGEDNSKVSVHTYDIKSHTDRVMKLELDREDYIPRIKFTSNPEKLAIITLNRHQDQMDIYMANPRSTVCKMIVRDNIESWINENAYADMAWYDNCFVMMSERTGWNHLYLYDFEGNLKRAITSGKFEVKDFLGWDQKKDEYYFTSNEESPMRKAVYKTDRRGRVTKLSNKMGTNNVMVMSSDMKYFINNYSSMTTPDYITICDNRGRELKVLEDNSALREKMKRYEIPTKEFFTFTTSQGTKLNGWIMKPADFDPNKKYPVILHQYSGPTSQKVLDQWNVGAMGGGAIFETYMTERGVICVSVDGRGTGGRGAAFAKQIYQQMGVKESEDQVATAKYMASLPYVDEERIGMWGWSFGGYCTIMSVTEGSNVFRAGVAIAPPTDWRFYDTIWTERYMRTPGENGAGYEATSCMNRAKNLDTDLLIIQGIADDNVHVSNTTEYAEVLVQLDKEFEMFMYTNRNHSIYGGNTRKHLMKKVAGYFLDKLK